MRMVRDLLDRRLGGVTMYRLMTIVLGLIAAAMVAYTAAGTFDDPYTIRGELTTLAVLLVASYASSRAFGLAFRVSPHGESAIITALLLFFIFPPETEVPELAWLAAAAVLGNASKYLLAWRGRHIFNPAAAGAFLVYLLPEVFDSESEHRIYASWWIASEKLLPFVALGAFLVLWRTRRLDIGMIFVVVAGALGVLAVTNPTEGLDPKSFGDALTYTANSTAIVFLAGFMLSEPLTLPPRRAQQIVVALVTAFVFAYPGLVLMYTVSPPDLRPVEVNQAFALLVGNVVAFAFTRRHGVSLDLVSRRQLTPETHEFTFKPRRPLSFKAGQFAELTVPHKDVDERGVRRSFSISSPPDAVGNVTFALRVPEKSSTFKRAMVDLEPGARVHSTGVGGDFLLPKNPAAPVALVAGGIGVTPFISQLLHQPDRDAVLVYGVTAPEEIAYADELAGFRVVIVSPVAPDHLPTLWRHVEAPFVSVDLVATAVPDLDQRAAYISGPPAMVNAVRAGLAKRCKRVKTDYFTGY